MKVAVINKETLAVCTIYTQNDEIERCLKLDFPEDLHSFVEVGDDVNIKNIQVQPDGSVTTQTTYLYGEIRQKRNELLAGCDWTQMPDSPLSQDKKSEWAEYRQALRNLPGNTTDPTNVTWPTPPSPEL